MPLLLFIFAFLTRWALVRNVGTNFDTYGHLYMAKEVKRQKVSPFGAINIRTIPPSEVRNPHLWHFIFGRLPEIVLIKHHKIISLMIDAFFAVLIYEVTLFAGYDQSVSLMVYVLYLFTPMWFSSFSMGPRIYSLTPRLFTEVCANIFFVVVYLPMPLSFEIRVITGIILASVVLLSSKFGIQVMFLIVPLASIIAWDITGVIILLIAVVFLLLISRGEYFKTIRYHAMFLHNYFIKNLKREMPVSKRNSLKEFIVNYNNNKGRRRLTSNKSYLLADNSYTGVLLKLPVLLFALSLYIYTLIAGFYTIELRLIAAPMLAATLVFLLVNLPPLLFLGEAERYLNHVAYLILIAMVVMAYKLEFQWILLALIGYGFLFWLYEVYTQRGSKQKGEIYEQIVTDILEHLNQGSRVRRIALYPYHAIGLWRILLETKHHVAFMYSYDGKTVDYSKYQDEYPYFKIKTFVDMASEFDLDVLITGKKSNRIPENWEIPLGWEKLNLGDDTFDVYERRVT